MTQQISKIVSMLEIILTMEKTEQTEGDWRCRMQGWETILNRILLEDRVFGHMLEGGQGNRHSVMWVKRVLREGTATGKVLRWVCAWPAKA